MTEAFTELMADYHALADVQEATPLVADVRAAICDFYGLSPMDLLSERRSPHIAQPRQVAMYLCRKLTPRSLPQIGNLFGGRDHSTVIHAIRRVEQRLEIEDGFSEQLGDICAGVARHADMRLAEGRAR